MLGALRRRSGEMQVGEMSVGGTEDENHNNASQWRGWLQPLIKEALIKLMHGDASSPILGP